MPPAGGPPGPGRPNRRVRRAPGSPPSTAPNGLVPALPSFHSHGPRSGPLRTGLYVRNAASPGRGGQVERSHQSLRIARGKGLPVVVEVRIDRPVAAPIREAVRPPLDLGPGVVAPAPARAVVEADVGERAHRLRLREWPPRVVPDRERGPL